MPYITQEARNLIEADQLNIQTPGELNYAITKLINQYIQNTSEHLHYTAVNDVLGALEGAKLEFYRRVAAPYEDAKIKENGDVY